LANGLSCTASAIDTYAMFFGMARARREKKRYPTMREYGLTAHQDYHHFHYKWMIF
jgi:hypothetical protein